MPRVLRRAGLAACALLIGTVGWNSPSAADDTRTISLHHVHTDENLTITYKKNGQYDDDALKKINWIMRDWRKNHSTTMDPKEIVLLWEVYQEVGAKEPIYIICGYRSPSTNEMLRNRSRNSGVARHSQHTLGKAFEFFIPGVPVDKLRAAAMKAQGGGVGYYPTSGSPFVHLDIGNVRAWPRMTREQLVKLVPDGRTVHVPSDGTPLPGYELAKADLQNGQRSAQAAPQKRSLLARIFGGDKDAEEVEDTSSARDNAAPARIVSGKSAAPAPTLVASAATTPRDTLPQVVPLPPRRPIYQIASADSRPVVAPAPAKPFNLASLTANAIVSARGLWDGATNSLTAQTTDTSREITASIGPFSGPDRVPPELALAYAAQAASRPADRPSALVSTRGAASIVRKPVDNIATSRTQTTDRLDDPWLRGILLTDNVQTSLVVTQVGDADLTVLVDYMRKPASAVVMTFSRDPYLGMTEDRFAGSAVVFMSTVTFASGPDRTAALR
jgi:uncharacterized protein YcbK (DUF882 family)